MGPTSLSTTQNVEEAQPRYSSVRRFNNKMLSTSLNAPIDKNKHNSKLNPFIFRKQDSQQKFRKSTEIRYANFKIYLLYFFN